MAARSHIISSARRQTPIQRMVCWIRPGPSRAWAIANPAPSSPSRFSRGTRQLLEDQLGVAGPVVAGVPHARDVAHPAEAGRVGGDDDQAGAAVGVGVGVGDGHHDREAGSVGRRGKPFAAVEHVVVAVPHRRGPHPDRVGAGMIGLGHGEATADRRRAPGAPASAPAARRCRTRGGFPCCRRRVPGR